MDLDWPKFSMRNDPPQRWILVWLPLATIPGIRSDRAAIPLGNAARQLHFRVEGCRRAP